MSIAISGSGGAEMTSMVSGASVSMSPQEKMTGLYNQIDTGGTGVVTQAQFNQTFQTSNPPAVFQAAGATAVWSALDPAGTGQVSQQDFVNGMKDQMVQLRQSGAAPAGAAQTSAAATVTLNSLGD
jgi:Ca2+-binding EF-hand superfamily protein